MTSIEQPPRPNPDLELITPKANEILHAARWNESVEPIISYASSQKTSPDTIPVAGTWGKALKATGGLVAIGWVDHPSGEIDKVTFYHPEDRFKTIHNIGNKEEQHINKSGYPKMSGYIYDDTDLATLTPTAITVEKLQDKLAETENDAINDITPPTDLTSLFAKTHPNKQWDRNNPTPDITVTPHALTKIKHCCWNLMVKVKYQYETLPNQDALTAEDIKTTLLATAGEVAIGWYDTEKDAIMHITFFTPYQDIANVRFATVTHSAKYGCMVSDIEENISMDQFRPIFVGVEQIYELNENISVGDLSQ